MKEYEIDGIPGTFTVEELDDEGPWRQPDAWTVTAIVGTIPMNEISNMWPKKEISIMKMEQEEWIAIGFDGSTPGEKIEAEISQLKTKYPKAQIDVGPVWHGDPHYSDK